MKLSLRWKIVLFTIMPIVGIYLSVMIFNIFKMQQWTTINIEQRMTELTSSYANVFDSYLRETALIAKMTAAFIENNPHLTSDQLYALLQCNLQQNPLVYGSAICFEPYQYQPDLRLFVRYVYRDGDTLRQIDPVSTGYDYTEPKQEYWHKPRNTGKAVWTEPYFDEGAGNILMCTYSVPFFRKGKFLGIATVDIPLKPLRELMDLGLSKDSKFSIITKTGKYVYSPYLERINKSIFEIAKQYDRKDLIELSRTITSGKTGVEKLSGWTSNEREWIFYGPVKSSRWGFAASISEKQALSVVHEQFYRNLAFLVISLVLIFVGLWFLSFQISRPITQLNYVASEIAKGNLDVKAEMKTDDEIGVLAGAFNEMARKLLKREQALRESEEKYRNLFENLYDVYYRTDDKGIISMLSPSIEKYFGFTPDELIGQNMKNFYVNPQRREEFLSLLIKDGYVDSFEAQLKRKDNSVIWVSTNAKLIQDEKGNFRGVEGISRDVSERKRMEDEKAKVEAQLQQARKMESIGTLAGGIAHDFNNVLYSIVGYTELTMDDLPEGSLAQKNLKEVLKGAMRAKDMVQQILAFSRKADTEKKPIKVQSVIKEALNLLRTSIPSTIEIRQNIDKDCSPVLADSTQIHQLVMNLATNAYQAMREKGGRLELVLIEEEIGSDDSDLNLDPGTYLKLTVSDTGHGMDNEVMGKIFDPYFSTKGPGEGTGMGLAVVHGITKDHGGDIKVYSKLGEGTVFHIYLPLIETIPVEPQTVSVEPLLTGTERILFVDDEEAIVFMTKQTLERLGYQVTSRTSSVEALEAFRAKPDAFDLVITDMTMPNMDGVELASRLKEIRSNIPIIICTGFSEMIDKDKAKKMGIVAYIMKPILKDEIAGTIRQVFDKEKGE